MQNSSGTKEIAIRDFYRGPGKVALAYGDILTRITIYKKDYEGFAGHYIKFAQRNAMDIANLSCAVTIKSTGGVIKDLRIAFGVAGPVPVRAEAAEEYAVGKKIDEALLAAIGEKSLECSKARNSWRASKEYREHLMTLLPGRALAAAVGGMK